MIRYRVIYFLNRVIGNIKVIPDPKLPIDTTTWDEETNSGGAGGPLQLSFMPGAKVQAKWGSAVYVSSYTRSASGPVIRFTAHSAEYSLPFFCVLTSRTNMQGSINAGASRWHVTKQ